MPKKIVHIITSLDMGGSERVLSGIASNMDRDLFTNIVVSLKDEGHWGKHLKQQGVAVYCLNMRPSLFALTKLYDLYSLLRQLKPDIVQGWLYHANLLALFAGKLAGIKCVYWNIRSSVMDLSHYRFATRIVYRLGAWLSFMPTGIINNSKESIRQHIADGYRNENWIYIPNGFDVDLFKPNPQIYAQFRQTHDLESDSILIGMIARFDPLKDHLTFIQAAGMLAPDFPNVRFVFAGIGASADNPAFMDLINQHGIFDQSIVLGKTANVHELLPALDCFALTSLNEGFPNVIGEAMACEVECLCTDVGDALELMGDTGYKIMQRDPNDLVAKWQVVLTMDPTLSLQRRQAARRRIVDHYSLASSISAYNKVYTNEP